MKQLLTTLAITAVCVVMMLFVSGELGFGIVVWIWGSRLIFNSVQRKLAVIECLMFLVYSAFWILAATGYSDLLPYTGMAIYLVIGSGLAIAAILGIKPNLEFAANSGTKQSPGHNRVSQMERLRGALVAIAMFGGFIASFSFFPSPQYIWISLGVAVGGSFTINFWFARTHKSDAHSTEA